METISLTGKLTQTDTQSKYVMGNCSFPPLMNRISLIASNVVRMICQPTNKLRQKTCLCYDCKCGEITALSPPSPELLPFPYISILPLHLLSSSFIHYLTLIPNLKLFFSQHYMYFVLHFSLTSQLPSSLLLFI